VRRTVLTAEEWAAHARCVLEMKDYPEERHVWLLTCVAMWEGKIDVELADVPKSYTWALPKERALIVVSTRQSEGEMTADLLEELGHCFLSGMRLGGLLGPKFEIREDTRNESEVRRFVLAWHLPSDCIFREFDEAVILERSGRTREELQERLSRITGCQI
jgi:hypothetical protein